MADEESSRVAVRSVTSADDPLLPAMRSLYQLSFTSHEREPWELLVHKADTGRGLLVAAEQAGTAIGLAFVHLLPRTGSALLLYLAARGPAGTGAALTRWGRGVLPGAGVRAVVGEVERVEDAADEQDAARRRRRLTLYTRWGAQLLPVPGYGMPGRGPGAPRLVPMHLLWHSLVPSSPGPDGSQLRLLITEIYEVAYGRGRDDPVLHEVLASVQPPRTGGRQT